VEYISYILGFQTDIHPNMFQREFRGNAEQTWDNFDKSPTFPPRKVEAKRGATPASAVYRSQAQSHDVHPTSSSL